MIGLGAIFTAVSAVSGIFTSWFSHKTAKIEAQRDVELSEIKAGVEVQQGSWKDEYLVLLWTLPIIPAILDAVLHWDPQMRVFLQVIDRLPTWYTGLLITITGASFGIRGMNAWKSGKLERELTWDRHEKNGNGKSTPKSSTHESDPYAAVRPSPVPQDGG